MFAFAFAFAFALATCCKPCFPLLNVTQKELVERYVRSCVAGLGLRKRERRVDAERCSVEKHRDERSILDMISAGIG